MKYTHNVSTTYIRIKNLPKPYYLSSTQRFENTGSMDIFMEYFFQEKADVCCYWWMAV